jgi:hypothetical protein
MVIGNLIVFSIAARLRLHKALADIDNKSSAQSFRPSNTSWRDYEHDDNLNADHAKDDVFAFRNTFSFDGMDETNQMHTLRSFSAA